MPLVKLNLPRPDELRNGWAAFAAVLAARGWGADVYATPNEWLYHDGGGNWVCLRFNSNHQAVMIGHDHEYTETYFKEAAKYFDEEETDLLAGAPEWWSFNLSPLPFGEWIGFIYGWDGDTWHRAEYNLSDGFDSVGLLKACSLNGTDLLRDIASDAPGLNGKPPSQDALDALVSAGPEITYEQLEMVVPGWDIDAGLAAARKFA
ncbi:MULTISPECIES: hypothetical protein [unclassified Halomonas]|uniref:hypothetical protein n=1 Tax=unclassified Halomonas TaxID=2609666 RepID=UPI0007D9EADD|nr:MULTISPECIES: hypothetical protein [unclassified Halomonas]MBT2788367.1 proteophosphoglycan 5 [Halomonas sp. ISL-106]MBT2797958.1 proteophosphoglycan 5 [Halomonas sp. ISL-104]OAL60531.1 hypothetical protein A6R74_17530 [Halomonas sp. ALS9]